MEMESYPGGVIAAAMRSTLVAVFVAIAALAAAQCYYALICECVAYRDDILDVDCGYAIAETVPMLVVGMPLAVLSGWGVPLLLFQMYCFYCVLYEEGCWPECIVWLFSSQLLVALIVDLKIDNGGWESTAAFAVALATIGAPYGYFLIRRRRRAHQQPKEGDDSPTRQMEDIVV